MKQPLIHLDITHFNLFHKMFFRLLICFLLFFEQSEGTSINNSVGNNSHPHLLGETSGYLANLTRCSETQLNLSKESLNYSWDLKGFLGYYIFMKKFNQIFEVKTDEISFKSDIVDGKWFFKISKLPTLDVDDITVTGSYSYEAKQARKLHFYIKFSLLHNNKEIVLPIQTSTIPSVMQQRLYNRRGYSSYLEFVHTFTWSSLGPAIEGLMTRGDSQTGSDSSGEKVNVEVEEDEIFITEERFISQNKGVGSGTEEDVTLKFGIVAYSPTDPVYVGSENCQNLFSQGSTSEGLARDVGDKYSQNNGMMTPPYVKHVNSMLHDERFPDVQLKLGSGQAFSAHRIILATSSPVFSLLLDNATDLSMNNNETGRAPMVEIYLDSSLNAEVTEELLRHIYTGKVESLGKIADKLILAAHIYELPELKKICEKLLFSNIQTANAIQMYDIGVEVGSHKISKRAFAVMKANKSKLVTQSDEFRRLSAQHPRLMFELFVTP